MGPAQERKTMAHATLSAATHYRRESRELQVRCKTNVAAIVRMTSISKMPSRGRQTRGNFHASSPQNRLFALASLRCKLELAATS